MRTDWGAELSASPLTGGRLAALKYRNDRTNDREGWLYASLPSKILTAYNAPRLLGRFHLGAIHGFVLEWLDGTPADHGDPAQAARVAAHVGAAHAATQLLCLSVTDRRLLPDSVDELPDEPLVFDSGDLNAANFLLTGDRVHTVDFEGAAVRRRGRAAAALPESVLPTYWQAGWGCDGDAGWRAFLHVVRTVRALG